MTLEEALQSETPLILDHPIGGRRIVAYGRIVHGVGFAFLDVGWNDPYGGRHPAHLIEGEISGTGPWHVRDCWIEVITEEDPAWDQWVRWNEIAPPRWEAAVALDRSGLFDPEP